MRFFQGRERSSPDHRRYSMLDPSALDSEVTRLRQRLLSTEEALRNALEHNQQVDQLVQAMRKNPEKSPVNFKKKKTRWRNMQPHNHISILQLVCVWGINPGRHREYVQTLHRKASAGSKCNHAFNPHLDCMHAARTRTFLVPNPISLLQMVAIKTVLRC